MSRLQRPGSYYQKKYALDRARALTIGRLLVDTYLSSEEAIKSSDYSLGYLS